MFRLVILTVITTCLLIPDGNGTSLDSGLDSKILEEEDWLESIQSSIEDEKQIGSEKYESNDEDVDEGELDDRDNDGTNVGVDTDGSNDSDDDGIVDRVDVSKEATRRRRRSLSANEILLSRPIHPLQVKLVGFDAGHSHRRRVKRAAYNTTKSTWPHHIPYVFGNSISKKQEKHRLRKVLDYLEDRLCVKFTDEGDRYNAKNSKWFRENGYKTNAYIQFYHGKGCSAIYGRGPKNSGPRKNSPCSGYMSMMHEVLHSLGGLHTQSMPLRDNYMTVNKDNSYRKGQYDVRRGKGNLNFGFFDSSSVLMYGPYYFSTRALPIYSFVRPEMAQLSGAMSTQTLMYEMNQNYKCAETFCPGVSKDCGRGYLTYVRDECVCVCEDQYNPADDCTTLINKAEGVAMWPNTPFGLFKGLDCPNGTADGTIPVMGKMVPTQSGIPISWTGKTLNIQVCTKTTPRKDINWDEWPIGSYCIGKVSNVSCGFPFRESSITMKTTRPVSVSGSVGDVTVDGRMLTIKFCCYNGLPNVPMKLPTDKPFRLLAVKDSCQKIEGMLAVKSLIKIKTKTKVQGFKPSVKINRSYFTHSSCYYIPPAYGCSEEFILSANARNATFSLPKRGSMREKNRRCFYAFKAPENSRLRLTFNKFTIHPNDTFYVKRFHPWTNPYRVQSNTNPGQTITERNYLFIEFWSSYLENPIYEGADLTVDLLLDDEMCYTRETQGKDYAGNKTVAETYETCVDWKDAVTCPDFPCGNKCRNLGVKLMLQPWCYSSVQGTTCVRRYCDVCNEASPIDMVSGCQERITNDSNFCFDNFRKQVCFKSCGLPTEPYDENQVKCGRPYIPAELTSLESLVDSYNIGTSVNVSCNGQTTQIQCGTHGWTRFDDQCTQNVCIDTSQLCQNALSNFPNFCTSLRSKTLATNYCKKSCGVCNSEKCSVFNGATYTLKSPKRVDVATGHSATFECNTGLYLVSGHLTRACSTSGKLLGEEPVCREIPPPVDVNLHGIYDRVIKRGVGGNVAFLLLSSKLRIPFPGKITKWYYYCKNNDSIHLLVYRETDLKDQYQYIGANMAKCVKNRPWTYDVPLDQQVDVRQGDLLGVYQQSRSVAHRGCGSKVAPVAVITKVKKAHDLMDSKTKVFPKSMCMQISVGAHVEPTQ